MADQSNLTISGIGADPSGSHPTGDLDVNWVKTIDDKAVKYTAGTIMAAPGASATDASDIYYSSELCVGTFPNGTQLLLNDLGDAQITGCWQYYVQSNGNNKLNFRAHILMHLDKSLLHFEYHLIPYTISQDFDVHLLN